MAGSATAAARAGRPPEATDLMIPATMDDLGPASVRRATTDGVTRLVVNGSPTAELGVAVAELTALAERMRLGTNAG